MQSKNSANHDPISATLFKKLSNLEILTTILAIISILFLITLLLFSRMITFNSTGPLLPSEHNSYAFATLYKLNNSKATFSEKIGMLSIFPDTNSNPSAFIKGFVNNLTPGSSHGVLLIENSNFLLFSDENDSQLFHFNPTGSLFHNCKRDSNYNTKNEGHMGDLGDIIANDKGKANIDKYINGFNVNLIFGRAIVILKKEDPCDSESFFLQKSQILAFGIMGIYSEDKEEIELKRQLIEKKKVNMFKFQEKGTNLKEATKVKEINAIENQEEKNKLESFSLNEGVKKTIFNVDNLIQTKIYENTKESLNLTNTKENSTDNLNLIANLPIGEFGKKNKQNLNNSNLQSLLASQENSDEFFKNNTSLENSMRLTEKINLNAKNPNINETLTNHLQLQRVHLLRKNPAALKRLPNDLEVEMRRKRKSLFQKNNTNNQMLEFSNITSDNPKNDKAAKEKITSIFQKLTNLIDSTSENTISKEGKPDIFVGIDLGNPLKINRGNKSNKNELKDFEKSFEDGIEKDLQIKLRKLEDKIN